MGRYIYTDRVTEVEVNLRCYLWFHF